MTARCVSGNAIAGWGKVTLSAAHLCDAVVSIQDPSTNRQLTMSEHKMIEAMVAQDQPSVEEEFLTAIETCCCE